MLGPRRTGQSGPAVLLRWSKDPARPTGRPTRDNRAMAAGTALVLGLRFLSEAALLVGAGFAGAAVGGAVGSWLAVALALVAMALVTILWGLFVAPQSAARFRDPPRMTLEVLLFGGTGAALALTGRPWWGLALAVAGVLLAMASRLVEPVPGRPAGSA